MKLNNKCYHRYQPGNELMQGREILMTCKSMIGLNLKSLFWCTPLCKYISISFERWHLDLGNLEDDFDSLLFLRDRILCRQLLLPVLRENSLCPRFIAATPRLGADGPWSQNLQGTDEAMLWDSGILTW